MPIYIAAIVFIYVFSVSMVRLFETVHGIWAGFGVLGGIVAVLAVLGDKTSPPRLLASAIAERLRRPPRSSPDLARAVAARCDARSVRSGPPPPHD